MAEERPKRKELKLEERMLAFQMLFYESHNGRPKKGSLTDTARLFSVDAKTISRLWRTQFAKLEEHLLDHGPDSFKDFCLDKSMFATGKSRRGRKKKYEREALLIL